MSLVFPETAYYVSCIHTYVLNLNVESNITNIPLTREAFPYFVLTMAFMLPFKSYVFLYSSDTGEEGTWIDEVPKFEMNVLLQL